MGQRPLINYNRCEGKGACVHVCPWNVFDLRVLTPQERGPLSLGGRLRQIVHGGRQAIATRADQCEGCARCVAECPEEAITLVTD